ncbi:MAG TPA: SDR family NAD(P)-dependent oxidoreductase [Pyrinomonadaceae bacterium]|jgi:NAD(P)-dependent dehydrogenase (short-subunit alcohol dehydrogenase family)|nr:SDR family NAD(P)-dependent oxidoreductase [Pyrinomonadaceae bacterium]
MEIEGKRILITGANRGLGRALALALAEAGAGEIVACARRPEELGALVNSAGARAKVTPVRLDVTSDKDVSAAAALGRVDVLVNSAGVAVYGGGLKAAMEDVRREIEINYLGVIRMVRAFAPAMAEHGDGLIVNVASILGKVSAPALGTYCATKAAVLSLSQSLRGDLADRGVRVIAVLPGTVDTDMSRGFDGEKMAAEQAAREIVEAIRSETIEAPIGDGARGVLAGLSADPRGTEKVFAQLRA